MLMEAFRKAVKINRAKARKNDSFEGAAYCLKMNFCRKTLITVIKQDWFTQNREEIVY